MTTHAAQRVRYSLVIPAWNEEKYLPRLLDTVDAARCAYRGAGAIEVIVADNHSSDRTGAVALERGCRVACVRKRCIAAARNGGARIARGEILCFVDADYRIHPATFNAIEDVMIRTPGQFVGGGTGLVMERSSLGIAATLAVAMALLLPLGIDGGVWFCRREDWAALGGYNESVPVSEDVRFLWALRRLGRSRHPRQRLANRFVFTTRAPAICSTRKADKHGDWDMLLDLVRLPFGAAFDRRFIDRHIAHYWYEDDRRDMRRSVSAGNAKFRDRA